MALKTLEETKTEDTDTKSKEINKSTVKHIDDFTKYRNEQLKLVRVKIFNNNPSNSDLSGRIYTVGNKRLGMVSKYVPFQGPAAESYHIPYILYKALKRRKYTKISTKVSSTGIKATVMTDVPEFSIQELPPLTKEQLDELAKAQALNRSFDDN